MAKKKEISKEMLQSLDRDLLVELVYRRMQEDEILYRQIEKSLLKNDQEDLVKSIKKEIGSLRRGRKFIDYYHAFDLAKRIAQIVEDIETLVEDPREAAALYKELILTDVKTYHRSDDSAGAIQMSYYQATEGWKIP